MTVNGRKKPCGNIAADKGRNPRGGVDGAVSNGKWFRGRYLDRKRAVTKACTVIAKQQMYHGGVSADITEANGRNVIMRHLAEEGGFLFYMFTDAIR